MVEAESEDENWAPLDLGTGMDTVDDTDRRHSAAADNCRLTGEMVDDKSTASSVDRNCRNNSWTEVVAEEPLDDAPTLQSEPTARQRCGDANDWARDAQTQCEVSVLAPCLNLGLAVRAKTQFTLG